jgi:hypothetical protein
MAGKLTEQPAANAGDETELHYVVQSGQTRRQTRTQLRAAILSAWQGFIGAFLSAASAGDARTAIGAAKSGANTDITSLTLTTSLPIAQGGTGSATATAARTALGVLNVGPDYINGLTVIWDSANSISITGGSAYIPSTGTVLSLAAAITKAGLVLTAATWYHVYLYSNAGSADVEVVTTAPSAKYSGSSRTKTGDTSRRYLFSFVTGAANTIIRFKHANNKVSYLQDQLAAPLAILANGLSTASAAVSASGVVPVTGTHACVSVSNITTAGTVYLNDADLGSATTSNSQLTVGTGQFGVVDFSLSSSQTLNYIYGSAPSGSGLFIRAFGYLFER